MSAQASITDYENIGPQQRRRRIRNGILAIALSCSLLGLLIVLQIAPWWRLGILPLCWIGLLGLLQAREKT